MKYVDTESGLKEVAERMAGAEWVAVDTEADSLHHYSEKLSLIQLTFLDEDYVVDPLAALPLPSFLDALAKKKIYFHAADSDVRVIKKACPFAPQQIFDTMIAAQLLGYAQIGLANLVEKHCGIKLSKAEQKADWSKRPLEEKLIRYAANDTHYLATVAEIMRGELKALGRESWHAQQCARLLQNLENLKNDTEPDGTEWQIKGARHLKGPALTYVKELWHWRDGLARQKDRPAFKIMNSEYLIQMAQWFAQNPDGDIGDWKEAPRHVKRDYRDEINHILREARKKPQAVLEAPERKFPRRKWTEKETKLLGDLKAARDVHGTELKIHPSLIATNAVLETLAAEKPGDKNALLKAANFLPWQMELVGEDFLKVLHG